MKGEHEVSKFNKFINNVSGKNVRKAELMYNAANQRYNDYADQVNKMKNLSGNTKSMLSSFAKSNTKAAAKLEAARIAQNKARLTASAGVGAVGTVGAAGLGLSRRDKTASEIVDDVFEKIY